MIPTYDQFVETLLRYLAEHPAGAVMRDIQEALAGRMGLTPEQRAVSLPSGAQAMYENRIGRARDRLKRANLSGSPKRGSWQLTPEVVAFAKANPAPLPTAKLDELTAVDRESRLRPAEHAPAGPAPAPQPETESPDDRLVRALDELNDAVATELLEVIGHGTPQFFEILVLDLLHAMGYGTSRSDLQHVGKSGDGGIDGNCSLDRLGLEKVYVQAKRWQNNVGRPDIQGFYGALAGQRAKKGVFITTSTFSPQAVDFARSVEGIVLIDGARLASLMLEHGVGVSHNVVNVPKVDSDYFEE